MSWPQTPAKYSSAETPFLTHTKHTELDSCTIYFALLERTLESISFIAINLIINKWQSYICINLMIKHCFSGPMRKTYFTAKSCSQMYGSWKEGSGIFSPNGRDLLEKQGILETQMGPCRVELLLPSNTMAWQVGGGRTPHLQPPTLLWTLNRKPRAQVASQKPRLKETLSSGRSATLASLYFLPPPAAFPTSYSMSFKTSPRKRYSQGPSPRFSSLKISG